MTDKQIIIDGVDVSGCECYSEHREGYCGWHTPCEGDTCPYKLKWALQQLKAKEQECERLKEENVEIRKYQYEQDFLQEQLEAYKMEAEEGKEINAELKAENEELNKYIKHLHNLCGNETDKQYKYKQTLTEIKEIAEPYNDLSGNCVIVNCFKDMNTILQKCEVLDE